VVSQTHRPLASFVSSDRFVSTKSPTTHAADRLGYCRKDNRFELKTINKYKMKRQILISLILLSSVWTMEAQTTRMSVAEIFDNNTNIGYFGLGSSITHGWDNIAPNALTISYFKDFAIGGWSVNVRHRQCLPQCGRFVGYW
jgi:hypothetical protein